MADSQNKIIDSDHHLLIKLVIGEPIVLSIIALNVFANLCKLLAQQLEQIRSAYCDLGYPPSV